MTRKDSYKSHFRMLGILLSPHIIPLTLEIDSLLGLPLKRPGNGDGGSVQMLMVMRG